jgi:predicted DNA-binding protein YlxM (UPF0122 family)
MPRKIEQTQLTEIKSLFVDFLKKNKEKYMQLTQLKDTSIDNSINKNNHIIKTTINVNNNTTGKIYNEYEIKVMLYATLHITGM